MDAEPTTSNVASKEELRLLSTSEIRRTSASKEAALMIVDEIAYIDECDCEISISRFVELLTKTGIRKTDFRLRSLFSALESTEGDTIDRESFERIISPNALLLKSALFHETVIPDFTGFSKNVEELYYRCKVNTNGHVATYIPELAKMDPSLWGIAVCTVDGQRYTIGDYTVPFSLQSCSKPITYAIVLQLVGSEVVHSYIGHEPSGKNFNEIFLDPDGKPHNPMINSGAIVVSSLIQTMIGVGMSTERQLAFIKEYTTSLAGGEFIGYNNTVYLSEKGTGDRNYTLGFFMKENKCFPDDTDLQECLSLYFRTCSLESNCDSLSVIAATLANGGICPTTDQRILEQHVVRDVLSIMHTCGMYNFSGRFAFEVGLPAKSSVSGALMLIIPNVMGIAMFSPPIDQYGNSNRCRMFCEELLKEFLFHPFEQVGRMNQLHKKNPLKHFSGKDEMNVIRLLFYASTGDVSALRRHYMLGFDMTKSDYDGRTALHIAAADGHLECVKFLLEVCKVPPNPTDRWGHVPKGEANAFNHTEIFNFISNWEAENVRTESEKK